MLIVQPVIMLNVNISLHAAAQLVWYMRAASE